MTATIRIAPRLARSLLCSGHDVAHLLDHAEQGRFIDLFASQLTQPRQRLPLLPERDGWMGQGAVGDLQVVLAFRLQYPDAANVARVAPDQEYGQAIAPRNPRLERVGVVVDVVDDEACAGQRAADHRQEIDQKRRRTGDDGRYADTRHRLGPARGRRLEQAVVYRAVIGADRQREPALQLAQRQGGLVLGVVLLALAGMGV